MNNGFRKGTLFGSILGASMGFFIVNRMNPFQRRRAIRSTKKAISNMRDGFSKFW